MLIGWKKKQKALITDGTQSCLIEKKILDTTHNINPKIHLFTYNFTATLFIYQITHLINYYKLVILVFSNKKQKLI